MTKEEVRQLVLRIKAGEGTDEEIGKWIEMIHLSTGNPDVLHAIMSSADIEIVMRNLYHVSVIQL
ncbi:MAG: hypothetical protein IJ861_04715 [Clostridia bacterium]|nr:hypothetical protein [Clostridia bacterium]